MAVDAQGTNLDALRLRAVLLQSQNELLHVLILVLLTAATEGEAARVLRPPRSQAFWSFECETQASTLATE